jgi:tRNA1Val (adenine37-N6)-methyltransferase
MISQKNKIKIDAVEIDVDAYYQAIENFNASPWNENIDVYHTDINAFTKDNYDCVFCNPPFYENELTSGKKTKDVAHHSDQLKLKHLFEIIFKKLNVNGTFYLLLPFKRKDEILELLSKNQLHPLKIVFVKHSQNHNPFRLFIKGHKTNDDQLEESELIISNDNKDYTTEFVELLKDYYLYL